MRIPFRYLINLILPLLVSLFLSGCFSSSDKTVDANASDSNISDNNISDNNITDNNGSQDIESALDLSKIVGTVTASKFKDAMVYVDLDGSGDYSLGDSQIVCSDENGTFSIEFLTDVNQTYIILAENQNGTYCNGETIRYLDDGTTEINPEFVMYVPYDGNGSKVEVNPSNFINYLVALGEADDINISGLETNGDIFKFLIKGKKDEFKKKQENVKLASEILEGSRDLEGTKEDLNLETNETITFINTKKDSVELSQVGVYKTQTVPAKIGNLVVSSPLNTLGKISELESSYDEVNNTEISEGVAAVSIEDKGSTSNNMILKKPIFSVISDNKNKIKLVLGDKTNIKDLGDITLSITPYESILSIPEYNKLRDQHKARVVLGADITVEDATGKRISVDEMSNISNAIAGVVLDKHNEINATGMKYYYFNGSDWIEDGEITEGGAVVLNDSFKLAPYVLAKPEDMQETKTITLEGLDNVKDPVIVAKSKLEDSTQANGKILYKNGDDSLVLDASAHIEGDKVTLRIPNGFNIDEIVIIGEKLDKLTNNSKKSVKIEIEKGSSTVSLEEVIPVIVDSSVVDEIKEPLIGNIHMEDIFNIIRLPKYEFEGTPSINSSDKQKMMYMVTTNINNFIGTPVTTANDFYIAKEIELSSNASWIDKYDDGNKSEEVDVAFDETEKKITATIKSYEKNSSKLESIETIELLFSNGSLIETNKKVFSSNNLGTETNTYNKEGSIIEKSVVYNKVTQDITNITLTFFNYDKVTDITNSQESSMESELTILKEYIGRFTVKFDTNFENIVEILDGEFLQVFDHKQKGIENNETNHFSVNGRVEITEPDFFYFEGNYTIPTQSYGLVIGDAIIDSGKYEVAFDEDSDTYYNMNSFDEKTILILKTNELIDQIIPGQDNGTEESNLTLSFGGTQKVLQNGIFETIDYNISKNKSNIYNLTIPYDIDTLNKDIKIGFNMVRGSNNNLYKVGVGSFNISEPGVIDENEILTCVEENSFEGDSFAKGCKYLPTSNIIDINDTHFTLDAQKIANEFNQYIPIKNDTVALDVFVENICKLGMNEIIDPFETGNGNSIISITQGCMFSGDIILNNQPEESTVIFGGTERVVKGGEFNTLDYNMSKNNINIYNLSIPYFNNDLKKDIKIGFDMFRHSNSTHYKIGLGGFIIDSIGVITQPKLLTCIDSYSLDGEFSAKGCKELDKSLVLDINSSHITIDALAITESFNQEMPLGSDVIDFRVYTENICLYGMDVTNETFETQFSNKGVFIQDACIFEGNITLEGSMMNWDQKNWNEANWQ